MSLKKISDEVQSYSDSGNVDKNVALHVAEVVDHHEKIKTAYNRVYYVFDGSMHMWIHNQEIILQKGDACFVEKGMIVEIQGTFSVIIVGQSPLYL